MMFDLFSSFDYDKLVDTVESRRITFMFLDLYQKYLISLNRICQLESDYAELKNKK